ncbi:unnamed protein product [Aphanomyces euteiches]|uniref:Histone-lysine N-methyltransferase, H3 lysine-79 specific n=1 Tax=Aphanomyces euteiches TaxID=100861 RepID=A0A6G0WX49_9STRA|nr:hypothetical protein Ae201684_010788 [Aphanomyces euteiches]KAH9061652.1 hypothetical protein Ae201684P_020987 [Aphanomyces euteiches]
MDTIDTVQTWKDQLMDYDPTEPRWKEAATRMREYATAFSEQVKQGGQNGLVDDVRALIPDYVKDELEALPISLFALGLIFYRPFQEYDRVYRHFTAEYSKELSLQARQGKEEFDTTSSVYGEIAFFPFADIIQSVTTELTGGVFYDLGSGVGKAVVAAALVHKFDKAVGIELLKPLVDFSHGRVDKLLETNDVVGQTISYICGSFFDHSWRDGDVVFSHSTCFTPSMWQRISKDAEKLKQGAYFISVSHILASPLFEVLRTLTLPMSWGMCTIYIQRRRRIGRWASKMLKGNASRTDLLRRPTEKENQLRE